MIDDHALAKALDDKVVAGAALDVFAVEPPPADHPLVGRPDVIVTPPSGRLNPGGSGGSCSRNCRSCH